MSDLLFLDANVLFSAAWSEDSRVRVLWQLPGARLVTSDYAFDEADRNLKTAPQRLRLEQLMTRVRLCAELSDTGILFTTVTLPDKDLPILLAAIESGATHLITGDRQHFGRLWGTIVDGVRIMNPRDYLRSRA